MYYLFLAQGIPDSLAMSLGPRMRRNSLYIRVKGFTHRHMGKHVLAHTHTPPHTFCYGRIPMLLEKKKKTVFKVTYERHSKISFSSFFIKPRKINLIKPFRVSKIEKINLPCMLQTQKGSQFSELFLALSFIKTFFQLRFYSDMEINVSTSFIIIIIANSSYLLSPCFFRHHARHFYIHYMSSSWYFSKTGISGPVLHMQKCSNKCKVTPQLVPRSTGLHSTLHSPRTSLVFLLAVACPNWSISLYLSNLASPFPCILWSELTKYNGASC